jgi:hypothetical protein
MASLIDDGTRAVNLRTICLMDHEPMHLYQALQGLMVVVTSDYTKANLGCKMILFQLLGVPYLN